MGWRVTQNLRSRMICWPKGTPIGVSEGQIKVPPPPKFTHTLIIGACEYCFICNNMLPYMAKIQLRERFWENELIWTRTSWTLTQGRPRGGDPQPGETQTCVEEKKTQVMVAPTGSLKRHEMFLCPGDLKRKHFLSKPWFQTSGF